MRYDTRHDMRHDMIYDVKYDMKYDMKWNVINRNKLKEVCVIDTKTRNRLQGSIVEEGK